MPTPVLALDLARQTGFAALRPDGSVASGSKALGPDDMRIGPLLSNYAEWLRCRIIEHMPDVIYYEQPWVGPKTHQKTALMLIGLAALTEMVGHQQRVMVRPALNPTAVKHFTGSGGGKREVRKARVMAECLARGWRPETQDEADAMAILDYARAQLGDPQPRAALGKVA